MSPAKPARPSFVQLFSGGSPRSLLGVSTAVHEVLANPRRLPDLFEAVLHDDESVRLRAGDALEKIAADRPELVRPYAQRLLDEVSLIHQPSVQWHLAQMLSEINLTPEQSARAVELLTDNLSHTADWIVENLTLEALAEFTRRGAMARSDFLRILRAHQSSSHKSVAHRAAKLLAEFDTL